MVSDRVKRFLTVGVLCVFATVALCGCGDSAQATSLPGLTKSKQANLRAILRTEFKTLGDVHPRVSSVTVFATGLRTAARASGNDIVTGHASRPVYLVLVRGHFSCPNCPGATPATARRDVRIFALVLDRATLHYQSGGSFGGAVNTGDLGPGMPLALQTGASRA